MSQPDEAPSIQEFFRWTNRERKYSRIDADTDKRIALNSTVPIKAYFEENKHEKLNAVLAALFKPHDPPSLAEVIIQNFTAVFTILLHIGKGKFIEPFAEHNSLDDDHLPFDPSNKPFYFPNSSDEDFFERFCRQQWRFCCPIFSRNRLYNEHFHEKRVLPIADRKLLGEGGSANLYKIRIHEDFNSLLPEDIKKKLGPEYANTFVLKTYVSRDAEKNHKNEVAAFQKLRQASHIIGYYGSYKHGETRHILLEYADRGDLEKNFMNVDPPQKGEDILRFWKGMLNLVIALIAIHAVRPHGAPDAPPVFQGLHQDVKPQNILVVEKEKKLPYGWQFKLGDLGLSQFEKLTSLKDRAAIDAQGTRTYGAPECYRADEVLAAAELPVTPAADIWSLGCIYSEAARWVATGKEGLCAYRQERLLETRQISNFGDGNCFHDGQHALKAVRNSHDATIRSLQKDDTITERILERLVDEMLHPESETRPTARQLWAKVLKILRDAEADLSRLVDEPQIRKSVATRPPPPPVLPHGKIPYSYPPRPSLEIRQDSFKLNGARNLSTVISEGETFLNSDGTGGERSHSPEEWGHGEGRPGRRRYSDDPDGGISRMTSPLQKRAGFSFSNRRGQGIWKTLSGRHTTDSSAEPPISERHEISNSPPGGRSRSFSVTGNSQRQGDFYLSSALSTHPGHTSTQNAVPGNLGLNPREKTDVDHYNEKFRDYSSEIKGLPEKLKQYLSKWFDGIPSESTGSGFLDPVGAVYIISCSKLHPISYSDLKTLIGLDRRHTGLKDLKDNKPIFEIDIHCPSCDNKSENRARSARQIEPLHYILAEIDKITGTSFRRRSTTLPTTLPGEEPHGEDIILTTSSSSQLSSSSSRGDSFNRSVGGPNDSGHARKHSGESSLKLKSDKMTRPSFSFSADGCSLLLWARDADIIVIYNIESGISEEFPAAFVHLAAGGANFYTTVSKKGSGEYLRIHDVNSGSPVASVSIESSVSSIALSRNDELVALGIIGTVLVYNTSNTEAVWRHDLPPSGDLKLKSQRVWFSTDSKKVIAATMYSNGNVHIYIGDCKNPGTDYSIPHINIPPDFYKDFGLSSALYDNKFGYAFITAFTSKAPPTLFTLRDTAKVERIDRLDLGTQIQCATSPPNPKKPEFILVNGDNNIFSVQAGSPWEVKRIGKIGGTSIFVREEMMAIAMPTYNTIYTFRVSGRQRMLTTINTNGGKISTSDISSSLSL